MIRRLGLLFLASGLTLVLAVAPAWAASSSSSVGVQGTVPGAPPTTGATITFPKNGQSFSTNPINVTGLCPTGLLVKLFKNNVFGGAAQCTNGSFSITTDLFSGRNDLVVRVYDDLDQAGPDSNTVTVTLTQSSSFTGNSFTLTSNYAKRGANPGESLTWPLIISGGQPPYAITVSWGDSKSADPISQTVPGTFDVQHVYDTAGVYTVVVKAADSAGNSAFLQLVGVANGAIAQSSTEKGPTVVTRTITSWWPVAVGIVFMMVSFWLGQRHELRTLLRREQAPEDETPPTTIDARS